MIEAEIARSGKVLMRISLPYGNSSLALELRGRTSVRIEDGGCTSLRDEAAALDEALENPVASQPFAKVVPSKGTIAVLVSDLTRGGAGPRLLGALLSFLERHGAGPDRVAVILALGMHRRSSESELADFLGSGVLDRWTVIEHDARDIDSLVDVGTTSAGTPCLLNRIAVKSSLVVTLGAASFHYFAGYGGGRKLILPGIASERTILANHRLSLRAEAGAGLAPGCRPGNLDGNPVHEDMLEGARLIGTRVFAVNAVAGGRGETLFVNAGELDASHRAACEFLSSRMRIRVERPYRAVVLSAGGYPKDINLLQSHKAIRHASYALDEGGLMLVAAECREGTGSESYEDAFAGGRLGVPDRVRRGYTLNAQAAISTYELAARFSIYLRSDLDEGIVNRFGFCAWKDGYEDFLLEGIADDEILVIEHGSLILPDAGDGAIRGKQQSEGSGESTELAE